MQERISTPSKTRQILEKYQFYFKKNFGQNFLIDSNILENIVLAAEITKEDCVLEIGPGIGSLTQLLAEQAKKVTAVEIDSHLIPILEDTLQGYDTVTIINQDILKTDLSALIAKIGEGKPVKVVANLPYYITTPILMELLEKKLNISHMTVMIQKEVAERINAMPKEKEYGALSVAVQYYCDTAINMVVPPSCFMPRPKVSSSVITLKLRKEPKIKVLDEAFFFQIVKCAFGQRRKTFINSLMNMGNFGLKKEEFLFLFSQCGIDEKVRGEALSLEKLGEIADSIYEKLHSFEI